MSNITQEQIKIAREKYITSLKKVSYGQSERWYQAIADMQPCFKSPDSYPWCFPSTKS